MTAQNVRRTFLPSLVAFIIFEAFPATAASSYETLAEAVAEECRIHLEQELGSPDGAGLAPRSRLYPKGQRYTASTRS